MPRAVETTEEQQNQDSLFYLVRRLPASWFKQADANESETDSDGPKGKTKKCAKVQLFWNKNDAREYILNHEEHCDGCELHDELLSNIGEADQECFQKKAELLRHFLVEHADELPDYNQSKWEERKASKSGTRTSKSQRLVEAAVAEEKSRHQREMDEMKAEMARQLEAQKEEFEKMMLSQSSASKKKRGIAKTKKVSSAVQDAAVSAVAKEEQLAEQAKSAKKEQLATQISQKKEELASAEEAFALAKTHMETVQKELSLLEGEFDAL